MSWLPKTATGNSSHLLEVCTNGEAQEAFSGFIPEFGRFRYLVAIGAGGFGVVYRADDPLLGREVAVKIPRLATLASADLRRRFQREARAVATLYHPGIVPVHEIGEVDGLCFIVSEFCPGPTLRQHVRERPQGLPLEEAVRIVICLAEAIDHAHGRNILHRDLKPDNVLLDSSHASAELPFTPRLTDFGIAKFVDENQGETISGLVLGTPRYMPPEQADGRHDLIGPSSDIYSLGVLLYEALTGRVPFQSHSTIEIFRQIAQDDPPPLRQFRAGIPRDLEAICLKCLEKTATQRYGSAGELARDLQRFLQGEPTLARPLRRSEQMVRWIRRHPAAASVVATGLAAALIVTLGTLAYVREVQRFNSDLQFALDDAQSARQRAVESERKARQLLYASNMQLATQAWRSGDLHLAAQIMRRSARDDVGSELRGFEWNLLQAMVEPPSRSVYSSKVPLYGAKCSPNGREAATWGADSRVRVFSTVDWQQRSVFDTHQVEINELAYSPDGSVFATTGDDGSVKTWNARTGQQLAGWHAHEGKAYGVQFTPDGAQIATCGTDTAIRLWSAATGERLAEAGAHAGNVEAIAISRDGRWLASGGRDGATRLWKLPALEKVLELPTPQTCGDLVFSDDSQQLITGSSFNSDLCVWDVATGQLVQSWPVVGSIGGVAFRPHDDRIAAIDSDGCIHLVERNQPPAERDVLGASASWIGHRGKGYGVEFARDGKLLLSVAKDGALCAWDWRSRVRRIDATSQHRHFKNLAFLRGDLWSASDEGAFRFDIDRKQSHACNLIPAGFNPDDLTASPDHRWAALGGWTAPDKGSVLLIDLELQTSRELFSRPAAYAPHACAFTPDGNVLFVLARSGDVFELHAVDVASGEILRTFPAGGSTKLIVLDDCGNHFLYNNHMELLEANLSTGQTQPLGLPHEHHLQHIALSPNRTRLAVASDRILRVLDATTGERLHELGQHQGLVVGLEFVDDGRRVISASIDGSVRVWDVESGLFLLELYRGTHPVRDLALSPDGTALLYSLERAGLPDQLVVVDLTD